MLCESENIAESVTCMITDEGENRESDSPGPSLKRPCLSSPGDARKRPHLDAAASEAPCEGLFSNPIHQCLKYKK
ncbi:unnamed protein product [Strongylus vulgaris]|uniref:Uncharacterized protein n=1 Tax=Strongylus vulgaris TaxID=40348 RepID=A0A3P7KJA9_STRVU|nr:unnamed protein product [Strongylus vulgaris]